MLGKSFAFTFVLCVRLQVPDDDDDDDDDVVLS